KAVAEFKVAGKGTLIQKGKDEKFEFLYKGKWENVPQGDKAGANKDLELLQGTWNIDTMEWGGQALPKELMNGYKFVFAGNKLTWNAAIGMMSKGSKITASDGTFPCDFKID